MRDHLRSYIHFLELEKNASANTVASYRLDLVRYVDFLDAKGMRSLEEIGEKDISGFLSMLREIGLSPRSAASNFSALKGWHKLIIAEGTPGNNPTQNIEAPKLSKTLPEVLNQDEIESIVNQPNSVEPLGIRDKALLETMYATGMRVT